MMNLSGNCATTMRALLPGYGNMDIAFTSRKFYCSVTDGSAPGFDFCFWHFRSPKANATDELCRGTEFEQYRIP